MRKKLAYYINQKNINKCISCRLNQIFLATINTYFDNNIMLFDNCKKQKISSGGLC